MDLKLDKSVGWVRESMEKIRGIFAGWMIGKGQNLHWGRVFFMLKTRDGVTQKQLCEAYNMTKQTVNRVIREMHEEGLILYEPDLPDKREKRLFLTPEGQRMAEAYLRPIAEIEEKIRAEMGEERIQRMREDMEMYRLLLKRYTEE